MSRYQTTVTGKSTGYIEPQEQAIRLGFSFLFFFSLLPILIAFSSAAPRIRSIPAFLLSINPDRNQFESPLILRPAEKTNYQLLDRLIAINQDLFICRVGGNGWRERKKRSHDEERERELWSPLRIEAKPARRLIKFQSRRTRSARNEIAFRHEFDPFSGPTHPRASPQLRSSFA